MDEKDVDCIVAAILAAADLSGAQTPATLVYRYADVLAALKSAKKGPPTKISKKALDEAAKPSRR